MHEKSLLLGRRDLKAAPVPGMSEGGALPTGRSWTEAQRPHSTGPCSPSQVLAFPFGCHRRLLKVLNRGITFYILLWLLGEELNDVQRRIENVE